MHHTKFNKDSLFLIKKSQTCFGNFYNRVVEGIICRSNLKLFIDFGFSSLIEYKNFSNFDCQNLVLISLHQLNSVFDNVVIDRFFSNKDFRFIYVLYFLKKAYIKKCFLKGRFLNVTRNGYSVGICGTIGFLSKVQLYLPYFNRKFDNSIFYISKLDLIKRIYILSQKNIIKQSSRVLFKLSLSIYKNKPIIGKCIKKG